MADRDPSTLLPGARLGPYEIVAPVGAGGMGQVYRAHDPRLGRDVAIKVLPPGLASSSERLRRFETEARATAALNHPHILAVYDIGTSDETPYVVSELLEGQTLRDALRAGQLPLRKVLDYARQMGEGLAAAHARGIVHRDLKPENVFVTKEGLVKILDFGLAKLARGDADSAATAMFSQADTQPGAFLGTVGYVAPEQATGRLVDFRSDQFAFGIVLYEMLAGKRPFDRESGVEEVAAILREDPRPIVELNPEVPLPVQWIVGRCLSKEQSERYTSTRDLVHDLEALAVHLAQGSRPAPPPETGRLPLPRTPLIGRETEVARASHLVLDEAVRLVTLTGPGGTGKTRLVLQVASDLTAQFEGGVIFVALASISDPSVVPDAVAQAFGVREAGAGIARAVKERLERVYRRPVLLVLDNFEQVLPAAGFVADLLTAAAPLKILVTSREPLHLYEEHEVPVPPLPKPDIRHKGSLDLFARNPAVRLFVERARASRPDFTLTAENTRAVAEICAHLDGLPLAIELAAARVKTLPPGAMLGRLQSRLQMLTGGARDLPERQQTLRKAIAWSHDLLDEPEQRLFRRLAVFAGGCTFEAAEAVCDVRSDLGINLLDGIESLVNKNLLQQAEQPDGEARLTMLETIREFGLERLAESGEDALTRRAHAAYYVVLAEEAERALEGDERARWLEALDRDLDNVRTSLDRVLAEERTDWGLRLGAAMFRYWEARELLNEGRRRLEALLKLPARDESGLRAKNLFAAGVLAWGQRDFPAACRLHTECLELYRASGDRRGMAVTLNALAVATGSRGDLAAAAERFEETRAIWNELGDRAAVARTLSNLAAALKDQRDYVRARQRQQEALEIFRELGDKGGAAWSLNQQADVARALGDVAAARSLCEEARAAFAELGDRWGLATSLFDLGELAFDGGDLAAASRFFRQGLEVFHALGHKRGLARIIEGFARIAARQGQSARGLRLAGAAAAIRDALGTPLAVADQQRLDEDLRRAERDLDTKDRSGAWIAGWDMTIEEALEYAVAADRP